MKSELIIVTSNRRARHDYHILEVFEAGLVLTGTEVKALREGRASLVDGYASIDGGEAWLENAHIPEYFQGSWTNHFTRRKRKLLLNRIEINRVSGKVRESGLTLVPLSLYFRDGRAKVEIALARGKKDYDKRQSLKESQDKIEVARAVSTKGQEW
jgi:SsrA-binding protein